MEEDLICIKGKFIKKRYIKCPHISKKCEWKLKSTHIEGYEYLDDSCYLSGSFILQCPD